MGVPQYGASTAPYNKPGERKTDLQSHVAFFDTDSDGVIWPTDTYIGFRRLRFGALFAFFAAIVIHTGFSYITWGSWIPDPYFRLRIDRMHRGKHGSDSQVYTNKGEFDRAKFDDIFKTYAEEPYTHLTFGQGLRMVHGNMNPYDPFGWFATIFEWGATYLMIWPKNPYGVHKDELRGVYDGTIFHKIAEESENEGFETSSSY